MHFRQGVFCNMFLRVSIALMVNDHPLNRRTKNKPGHCRCGALASIYMCLGKAGKADTYLRDDLLLLRLSLLFLLLDPDDRAELLLDPDDPLLTELPLLLRLVLRCTEGLLFLLLLDTVALLLLCLLLLR